MRIFPCLLLLALVGSVHAAEKLEGAFGLKLGDSFGEVAPPKTIPNLGQGFAFTPKNPNPAFSEYVVFLTPQSHLIYRIAAVHREEHEGNKPAADHALQVQKCNEVIARVTAILRQKYQDKPEPMMRILQGNREVSFTQVNCDDASCEAVLVYEDSDLGRQAGQEEFTGKQKKLLKDADPTGL